MRISQPIPMKTLGNLTENGTLSTVELTSTSTKRQKAFYIDMLVTFVFKYMNLGKLYLTWLSLRQQSRS